MTDFNPLKWQEIFAQLIEEGHYDVGSQVSWRTCMWKIKNSKAE
jgi:hypothetical protein